MTDSQIPEINIKVTSVEVKGGKSIKMTVRNIFYRGFWGKIRTVFTWLFYQRGVTFKEYLDSPVTYERVMPPDIETYHNIDAEEELIKLLNNEQNK